MQESIKFSKMHSTALYGGSIRVKLSKGKFEDNSKYAHLIGRSFTCEKIIARHASEPYGSIDELLGDLQIELVNCMNTFRRNALYHSGVDKYRVEQFL
jgi:hypothetical protein